MSIPTLLIFKDGQRSNSCRLQDKSKLAEKLKAHM